MNNATAARHTNLDLNFKKGLISPHCDAANEDYKTFCKPITITDPVRGKGFTHLELHWCLYSFRTD